MQLLMISSFRPLPGHGSGARQLPVQTNAVHIRVFDGYEWKDYYQGTGVVPVDGTVDFEYSVSCDRTIVNAVEVAITIQET